MLMRLFECGKHRAWKFLSIENCCLKISSRCLLFVNCLYESQQAVCKMIGLYEMNAKIYPCWDCIQHVCKVIDVVYKVKRLFARWMQRYILADMFYKDIISANDVYILLIGCWDCLLWFIICKRVVWMFVNNDMNLLRIW